MNPYKRTMLPPRLLTWILLVSVLFSCVKDKPGKTELLTNGKWQITEHLEYYAGIGYPPRDLYAQYLSCDRDNYYVFRENGTGEIQEGATKCDPNDPSSTALDWNLEQDETHIRMLGEDWRIGQLNASTFSISTVQVIGGDGERITFTHIP